MRERNWSEYNKKLVQRGSLEFLIDPKVFKKLKTSKRKSKPGRPQKFSDPLMLMLMMIKVHFSLPYRSLEGFSKFIFKNLQKECELPTYTSICKRVSKLKGSLPKLSRRRPETVLLDASGLKVYGEGEWKVKIHGKSKRRKWIKVHIAVDPRTQEIQGVVTTESNVADSTTVPQLLDQIHWGVKQVIADGAYDRQKSRTEIRKRRLTSLIPPPKNARYKGKNDERDLAVLAIQGLGGDADARSLWGKLSGYSIRALVETAFSSIKRLFGDRLFSQITEKQEVENYIRCLIVNKMKNLRA